VRRRRSGWVWGGRVAALVVLAGLAVYLSAVGLDKADKLASVLSLLVAVAGLVVPYLLSPSDKNSPAPTSTQYVANTVVGGHLTQARDAKDLKVQGSGAAVPPKAVPSGDKPVSDTSGGQYVNGVWVGGNLTQIDGADGDVTLG
jgi:hypothetical protein